MIVDDFEDHIDTVAIFSDFHGFFQYQFRIVKLQEIVIKCMQ